MDIKTEVKEEVEEIEVIAEATNGSQQISSSQRNSENGSARREYKYSQHRDDEPMELDPSPPEEEPVRPITPPLRERTRSRSRSRERSAELEEVDELVRSETRLQKKEVAKSDIYHHNIYYTNTLEPTELSKSASQRICKVFGTFRYAVEAFELGHHVFYAADNFEDRRAISDYVRKKTLAEYKSASRVFIIGRNEIIARERYCELAISHYGVYLIPFNADSLENHRCYLSTIETFRTFYLKFPGLFNKDDVFVFEDFQYFGHPSVGHFFEEALLVPPSNGQFIFLTPGITNADELSTWICKSEGNVRPVDCITVLKRKSALKHFITRKYERTMGEVVDENGEFQERPFLESTNVTVKVSKNGEKKKDVDRQTQISKLVRTVLFRVSPPILIYSYDTEDIENTVNLIYSFGFNSEPDQFLVDKIFSNEMKRISKDDSDLKEVRNLLPFLQRGIAPYHYGMFPFLRKIIKALFTKGLIKVVVADGSILYETNIRFHAAIIMRDRYLVEFGQYRWIKPSEYNEICERVDGKSLLESQIPLIILINGDEDMPIDVAKQIFTNNVPTVESQLQITPALVLSAIQSPILREDDVFKKSFGRLKRIVYSKQIQNELRQKSSQLLEFPIEEEELLHRYQQELDEIEQLKANLRSLKFKPVLIKSFMDVGRVVKILMNSHDFGYGIIVYISSKNDSIDVMLNVTKESYEIEDDKALRPAVNGLKNKMVVCRCQLTDVAAVTTLRLSLPESLYGDVECNAVCTFLNKMVHNYVGDVPELEIEHLGIRDQEATNKNDTILRKQKDLKDLKNGIKNFRENYERYEEKQKLEKEVDALEDSYQQAQCTDAEDMQRNIFNLLGPFNYYDNSKENLNAIAEFAINLPIKENILLAELFFKGFFDDKSPRETHFILSTFIDMEVTLEKVELSPSDKKLFEDFKNNHVQKFAHHLRKMKIIEPAFVLTYMNSFNATLFDFLDVWCKKLPFNTAMIRTDIRSGFIATYLERLHELLVRIIAKSHLLPPHPDSKIIWKDRLHEMDVILARDIPFATV